LAEEKENQKELETKVKELTAELASVKKENAKLIKQLKPRVENRFLVNDPAALVASTEALLVQLREVLKNKEAVPVEEIVSEVVDEIVDKVEIEVKEEVIVKKDAKGNVKEIDVVEEVKVKIEEKVKVVDEDDVVVSPVNKK